MASRNTTGKTTALVRQRHGGALATGGTPGNRGGTGRPKDEIRAVMRESLEAGLHVALQILKNPKARDGDKLKALDLLARYGLGTADPDQTVNIAQLHIDALRQSAQGRVAATLLERRPAVWRADESRDDE